MTDDELYYIKRWDNEHCLQHIISFFDQSVVVALEKNYTSSDSLVYIDIGANVGKMYDLLKLKSSINIEHAFLIEGSSILCDYMIKKYSEDHLVSIYNSVILDIEENISFNDSYIKSEISNKPNYINFGLSQINKSDQTYNIKQTIKLSNFLIKHNLLNKKLFIKIDTENSDFLILQDILSIISKLVYKPMIEFEVNYERHGMSIESAQKIMNEYTNYNYQPIDILTLHGDGLLIPN